MSRIRTIKPEFFDDPDIAELSFPARLLFIGLWTEADREGRLVDDPRRLKARLMPYDAVDLSALLVEIHDKGLIVRYPAVERNGYIWVRSFTKHQRPHPKEPASLIPPPPGRNAKRNGEPRKETASRVDTGILDTGYLDSGSPESGVAEDGRKAGVHPAAPSGADAFDRFWLAYPKKTGKGAALKAWKKIRPDEATQAAMLSALDWQRVSDQWTKERGEFIPNPATWLNQARWMDEPRLAPAILPAQFWTMEDCPHEPHCASQFRCNQVLSLELFKADERAAGMAS